MKLTKAPKIDVKYGLLQNEKEWVNWVAENLSAINKNTSSFEMLNIASQLFKKSTIAVGEKDMILLVVIKKRNK